MTKYHVEFDIESDQEWVQGRPSDRGFPFQTLAHTPNCDDYELWIPKDAVITDITPPPALKVGDVLATQAELERLPGRSVALDAYGDAWQVGVGGLWDCTEDSPTYKQWTSSRLAAQYHHLTVIHIPDA